jgi:hypothetical protein
MVLVVDLPPSGEAVSDTNCIYFEPLPPPPPLRYEVYFLRTGNPPSPPPGGTKCIFTEQFRNQQQYVKCIGYDSGK